MGPGSGLPSQLPLLPRPMAMESKKYKICELFSVPPIEPTNRVSKVRASDLHYSPKF